ncbi:MAG: dienelactone hydrolase family protein [Rhodobacteraceae bacterium]|nr:dienelactone hydrolase family protein [Paracoccaceae bacterium]
MSTSLESNHVEAASGTATSLVVFLHGYGADGADLLGLADVLGPHLPNTEFHAPNAPERCVGNPFGFQWFPIPWLDGSSEEAAAASLSASAKTLNSYLDDLISTRGIPAEKICLVGFSQGTMMSLHVAPRRPDQIAGIVGFSGRLLAPEKLDIEAVSKPPILLVHGDQDDVVPFASMAQAASVLDDAGFDVHTHVMPGTAHGISPDGLSVCLAFLREKLTS